MPIEEFLEGASAILLEDGTRAYHAVRQAASSCLSKAAANAEPGHDLALPLIATSLVPLLSTYMTQGRFLKNLRQIFTQRTSASSSASKMTVDFSGYPKTFKSASVSEMEMAASCFPSHHRAPLQVHTATGCLLG